MIYVIVRNEVFYHRFFEIQHQAFGYMIRELPADLKNDFMLKDVKTYLRHKRLYVHYRTTMIETPQKDVYSIEKVSLINVLNWMAEAKENKWIRQYIASDKA